jgi:hypothetical protein
VKLQLFANSDTATRLKRLEDVVDKHLGFGTSERLDGTVRTVAPGSTTTSDNGTPDNIYGSYAQGKWTSAGAAVRFYHNLGIPVVTGTELNVRWIVMCKVYQSGITSTTNGDIYRLNSDPIGADWVDLRFGSSTGGPTVTVGNPVWAELFFIPGVRDPL